MWKVRIREKRQVLEWLNSRDYPDATCARIKDLWWKATNDEAAALTKEAVEVIGYTLPTAELVSTKRLGHPGHSKRYKYHRGSVYQGASMQTVRDDDRQMPAGRVRAVQAPDVGSLPTARVREKGAWGQIRIDAPTTAPQEKTDRRLASP
ncbi:hypothetical protein GN244_ATG05153 [Phytophthora infestans]|uniref:Uncharacterized protein n=1 Tax=Phytophthora infestans TaxID=4787 RepID=A0A833W5B9_PHYIN|nr:hypothetical protein GN244_ATG05153 [Phytophthora infestans]